MKGKAKLEQVCKFMDMQALTSVLLSQMAWVPQSARVRALLHRRHLSWNWSGIGDITKTNKRVVKIQ